MPSASARLSFHASPLRESSGRSNQFADRPQHHTRQQPDLSSDPTRRSRCPRCTRIQRRIARASASRRCATTSRVVVHRWVSQSMIHNRAAVVEEVVGPRGRCATARFRARIVEPEPTSDGVAACYHSTLNVARELRIAREWQAASHRFSPREYTAASLLTSGSAVQSVYRQRRIRLTCIERSGGPQRSAHATINDYVRAPCTSSPSLDIVHDRRERRQASSDRHLGVVPLVQGPADLQARSDD